jgi:hypothetical protein
MSTVCFVCNHGVAAHEIGSGRCTLCDCDLYTTAEGVTDLSVYPGPHPGTGFNDHLHLWKRYPLESGGGVTACSICGRDDEATHST